jgi:hypothetical protein
MGGRHETHLRRCRILHSDPQHITIRNCTVSLHRLMAGHWSRRKAFISRFRIVGADIIEDDEFQHHYKILQDNESGIVAVWSISERQEHDHPYVGGEIIIIYKQTNEFKLSAVTNANHGPNLAPSVGSCIPN